VGLEPQIIHHRHATRGLRGGVTACVHRIGKHFFRLFSCRTRLLRILLLPVVLIIFDYCINSLESKHVVHGTEASKTGIWEPE